VKLSAPELEATNERLKNLACALNDQLRRLRDKISVVDQELKKMAKGVKFSITRARLDGVKDMVSPQFFLFSSFYAYGCIFRIFSQILF
jgi:G:T-mismatch repair DNA endonuclease (very short patch repair protein)